jgi:hypothetical protein
MGGRIGLATPQIVATHMTNAANRRGACRVPRCVAFRAMHSHIRV